MRRSRQLAKALAGGANKEGVLALIKRNGWQSLLPEIINDLHHMREVEKKESKEIFAGRELNSTERQSILRYLDWDEKETKFRVDPGIVGGFIARDRGRVVDGSLTGRIAKMQEVLGKVNNEI